MEHTSTAQERIEDLRNFFDTIRGKLDGIVDEIQDAVGENEEAEAALDAQPALLGALRESEHGLTLALARLKALAPSPLPSDWHMLEPQWAIRTALERVARKIDEHLA